MNKIITVFTPTFNRGDMLIKLYKSLCKQTNQSFIWLIVDDGSKDDTKEIVNKFMLDKIIDIYYYQQDNAGKYVAHNTGVKLCCTELFVCVDSDDYLLPNAIERTIEFWETIRLDKNIAGIVSPKDMDGKSFFKNPPSSDTLMHLYDSRALVGETMLVYRTSILKKYLFPEIDGEKFMSENIIYYQIDQHYNLAVQNEYLYSAEYLDNGITKNIAKTHWKNPKSTLLMYKSIVQYHYNNMTRIKALGCYYAWKSVRELKDIKIDHIPLLIRIGGILLYGHYYCLFIKQKKEYNNI